jgi:ribosomal protein S18 acetylase RimI-like enzyme
LAEAKKSQQFFFEPLGPAHDRAAFSCEQPHLERYIKTQARQDASKNLAAVFIVTVDGRAIAGFYTLSHYSIWSADIPQEIKHRLTKHDQLPATLIGRLARHTEYRGTGAGDTLLVDALRRCLALSTQAASRAVVVEAENEGGTAFYRKFGFEAFPGRPLKMFLPTATIEKMFA